MLALPSLTTFTIYTVPKDIRPANHSSPDVKEITQAESGMHEIVNHICNPQSILVILHESQVIIVRAKLDLVALDKRFQCSKICAGVGQRLSSSL